MKKYIILCIILFTLQFSYSQDYSSDFLVNAFDETEYVKIIGLEGKKLEYIKEGKKKSKKMNFYNLKKMNITNLDVIHNPLNIKIQQPEPGYAYVYIYRPYIYLESALGVKMKHNKENLANITTNSYFFHKVKAGVLHTYEVNAKNSQDVEINAEDGEIYYIRVSIGPGAGSLGGTLTALGQGKTIFLDDPDIAKYAVLTMEKESPIWN